MTDTVRLQALVEKFWLKYIFLAENPGITSWHLQKKTENDTEFKSVEISKLTENLSLSAKKEDIFLLIW